MALALFKRLTEPRSPACLAQMFSWCICDGRPRRCCIRCPRDPSPAVYMQCLHCLLPSQLVGPLLQVGLFREDDGASQEVIGFMLNSFEDGFGIFLPPAGSTPTTLASVLLHFLVTLPEPLLTFKCARYRLLCKEESKSQMPWALSVSPA